jgi:hypothetical protein
LGEFGQAALDISRTNHDEWGVGGEYSRNVVNVRILRLEQGQGQAYTFHDSPLRCGKISKILTLKLPAAETITPSSW